MSCLLPLSLYTRVFPQICAYVSNFVECESVSASNFEAVGTPMPWLVAISLDSEEEALFLFVGNLVFTQSHTFLNFCLRKIYTSMSIKVNLTFYLQFKSI